ncbi:MAG: glycoside hydrolase family 13 protein [Mycoplasma sp.]|nr:glycoside hydrolase family 13 protein [Mycoplasma sp.]
MLETFYHRSQSPWIYQLEDNGITVEFRIAKNKIKRAYLLVKDPMASFDMENPYFELRKTIEMVKEGETIYHEYWSGSVALETKRYRYAFKLIDENDKEYVVGYYGLIDKESFWKEAKGFVWAYWDKDNNLNVPSWYKKTNWYQIFPDRFNRVSESNEKNKYTSWQQTIPKGHELYGGNLEGIIEKLEYIKSIGFNGVYLTPIFKSNSSHRYATIDYYEIDPILGDEKTFKKLIDKAHQLDIKIMIDAVYNHMSALSPIFQDVIKNKEKSKYYDWFKIRNVNDLETIKNFNMSWNDYAKSKYPYETFAFVADMPRLNWSNLKLKNHLFESAKKWTNLGIDGWRLDVSNTPTFNFWREFKKEISKIKNDIVIIGEVWYESINWLLGDQWHGVMNYPLRDVIFDLIRSNFSLEDKQKFVYNFNIISYQYTPEQQWGLFNLLSSHDTARLITLLKNDKKKFELATSILFFQPGATSTYYGEEIGLEGGNDPDCRRPMAWKQTFIDFKNHYLELTEKHKKLANHVSIFNRTYAKLDGDNILLINSKYQVLMNKDKVELKLIQ